MSKQSSSLSSPREMNGSASSEELEEEVATDDSDLEARSCSITLKYFSSIFALAKRDWALDFLEKKVFWALVISLLGPRRPFKVSQVRTVISDSFDFSSNFDHHLILKVLCKTNWVS